MAVVGKCDDARHLQLERCGVADQLVKSLDPALRLPAGGGRVRLVRGDQFPESLNVGGGGRLRRQRLRCSDCADGDQKSMNSPHDKTSR